MKSLVQRSIRKWLILGALGLVAYFSGWILGTRSHNLRTQTVQNKEIIDAGVKDGAGGTGLLKDAKRK